jgi:hypothetical protein
MEPSPDALELMKTWSPVLERHRTAIEDLESALRSALTQGFAENRFEFARQAQSAFESWSTSSAELRAATRYLFERAARNANLSQSDIRDIFFIDTEDDAADAREY